MSPTLRPMTDEEKSHFFRLPTDFWWALGYAAFLIGVALITSAVMISGCHLHFLETTTADDPALVEWKDDLTTQVNANTTRIAEEHPHGETEPDHPAE